MPETRSTERGYAYELSLEQHELLSRKLDEVRGLVIVSGYRSTLYDEIYQGWHRMDKRSVADAGKATVESIWLSPRIQSTELPLFT
ncbi:hypothetical protein [Ectothiorhodospira variabilis]|uniref:hypothetical protein n=1 Tax=Ectothiorhodospira variabilis TaxID=505694 RepID=UPI001EFBD89F|nr:hypothetical protein [Ectothiorhodospira variabilis]MCG5495555.1 hypothetical protein [Ectothiorhodospira variabilis]MCG5505163.1 hypothetical protein [Ectothiorhodospira variabilis]MCG5508320.1 hypothetical protein [Ectothiorhodospira variabilis]